MDLIGHPPAAQDLYLWRNTVGAEHVSALAHSFLKKIL